MAEVSASSSVVVGGSLAEVVEDDDLAFRPGGCRLDPADKPENIDESCESTLPDTGFGSRKVTDLVDLLVPPLDGFRSIEDGNGRAMSLLLGVLVWFVQSGKRWKARKESNSAQEAKAPQDIQSTRVTSVLCEVCKAQLDR